MSQDEAPFRCTTDAVHGRFIKRAPVMPLYCSPCDEYFTKATLKAHFIKENKEHKPMPNRCEYCRGNAYEYMDGTVPKVYHNCTDASNAVPLSTSSSPSSASLASSTSLTSSSYVYGSLSSHIGSTSLSSVESEANEVNSDV